MVREVVFRNEEDLKKKKNNFIEGGNENFHVLADFDKTLTTLFLENGKKMNSVISIIRNGPYLGEDYSKKANELFEIYHPFEIDLDLPLNEKKAKMYEWWEKHFTLLGKSGLTKGVIGKVSLDMIKGNLLKLRKGVEDFIKFLNKKNIPLVIVSASVGDLIKEFLGKKGLLLDNVYVIANEMEYDEEGNFTNVKNIVHVFNKDETAVKNYPEIYGKINGRKNVLLLGDSLGDLGMIEGFDYENLINVGFLNENVEGNLEKYKNSFDVVITNDGNFDWINKFVEGLK